jgi:hypothetical protein
VENFHLEYALLEPLRATATLEKFCADHSIVNDKIAACCKALEARDCAKALDFFNAVPIGGMGTFLDQYPPVVFQYESSEYVFGVFNALVWKWCSEMQLLQKRWNEQKSNQ